MADRVGALSRLITDLTERNREKTAERAAIVPVLFVVCDNPAVSAGVPELCLPARMGAARKDGVRGVPCHRVSRLRAEMWPASARDGRCAPESAFM